MTTSPDERARTAQAVRDFLALHQVGVLSTISRSVEGFPFGSVTPYDVDAEGRPVIFISRIAEHFRNLTHDSRASFVVIDGDACGDPQAFGRATLVGRFLELCAEDVAHYDSRYNQRFPHASSRALAHDFRYFRLEPERIRWIAGFGKICWIEPGQYRVRSHDPVSYCGASILAGLNAHYSSGLYQLAGNPAGAEQPAMVRAAAVSSAGLTLAITELEGTSRTAAPRGTQRRITFPFAQNSQSQESAWDASMDLLQRAARGDRPECHPEL